MSLPPTLVRALNDAGVPVLRDAPLAKKTWWRVGGPADAYIEAPSLDALLAVQRICHAHGCPVFVLGNASNLLISDLGIRGVVVRLTGALAEANEFGDGAGIHVGAGCKLVGLLRTAGRRGWTGLEMIAGVPGTVGGGIRMNAGTRLGELGDRLLDVTIVGTDGIPTVLGASALALGYRTSHLPDGAIVATASLALTGRDPEESRALVEAHLAYRARTQPTDVPTCGSTFRNPEGDHAGRLIEATGLKGFAVGAARVSPKHANFVVNEGGARAADIRRLIETVQDRVEAAHGVRLQREVHYAGEW